MNNLIVLPIVLVVGVVVGMIISSLCISARQQDDDVDRERLAMLERERADERKRAAAEGMARVCEWAREGR